MPTKLLHRRALAFGSALFLGLLGLGCGGTRITGDRAGTVNQTLVVTPGNPTLTAGQSLQFQATAPWGSGAQWSVEPASAGTITPGGLFTAYGAGTCTVLAAWIQDVRYAASTVVTIVPALPQAVSSPNYVQASGASQATSDGATLNYAIVGEPAQAVTSTSATQSLQIRHGFLPPVPALPN